MYMYIITHHTDKYIVPNGTDDKGTDKYNVHNGTGPPYVVKWEMSSLPKTN